MTTQTLEKYERYKADFQTFTQSVDGPSWLHDLRGRGYAAFDRNGLPTQTRGNEKWKYTNLTPLTNTTFSYPLSPGVVDADKLNSLIPTAANWIQLVFVDGRYSPELSKNVDSGEDVTIGNLTDIARSSPNGLSDQFGSLANIDHDGFSALNTAFANDGAVVKLAPDSTAPPIHLVFVTTEHKDPVVTHPRTLIVAGPHSKSTILESYIGLSNSTYLTNSVSEIVLEPRSQIEHYRFMMDSPKAFHIGSTPVRLLEDSSFNSFSFARGGRVARNDLHVMLDAPGSSCVVGGLYFTYGTQHIDNHINIDHLKPHTSSDLYFKGILDDRSRAVFSGGVIVHPGAQKSVAFQKDQNLLLSEGARINTKPMLEIYADDIQAMHGATAGAVADEAIFYMQSRGIDEESARDLLIHGFATEVIDRVRLEPFRAYLDEMFAEGLPKTENVKRKT